MKHTKFFKTVVLLLVVVLFTTSCQTPESKKGVQLSDSARRDQGAHKILFKDSIPQAHGYVNDYDLVYTPAQKATLDSLIGDFEKETTMQIVIIAFNSTMVEIDSLESTTMKIANIWRVGQKDKNNGIAIGICRDCRKMTIQNGSGTEKILSNAETKQIIDNSFIPGFKEGNYFEGTLNGLKALISTLKKKLGL